MSLMKRRTITKDQPLASREVREFISKIEVGDIVPTMVVASRIWTSTVHFTEVHKPANVTILKKYPYQVLTSHGLMTWTDLVLGYFTGIIPAMFEDTAYKTTKKAA